MSTEWSEHPPAGGEEIPGRVLKARREEMGWSVEQVADQLKLAPRQVAALEEGDYAALPPAAVVRGFVRAYAKVMKIDAAPLVARIPVDAAAAAADASASVRTRPQSFSEVRFPTNGKRSRMPWLVIGVVVAAVAAVVAAWQSGVFDVRQQGSTEPVAAPALPASNGTVTEPVAAPVLPQADQGAGTLFPAAPAPATTTPGAASPGGATPAGTAPAGAAPAGTAPVAPPQAATPATAQPQARPATAGAPASAAAPAGTSPNALVLDVNQESWIELTTASGKLLMARLVAPGTVESIELREPATLVVGNPAGVSATLKGASLPLPARRGTTVARVKIAP